MTEIVTAYKMVRFVPGIEVFRSPIVPLDLALEFEVGQVTRPEIPDSGIYCHRDLLFWSDVMQPRFRLLRVEGEVHPFQYRCDHFPLTIPNLTRFWSTRAFQDAPVHTSTIVLTWVRPLDYVYPQGVHPDDYLEHGLIRTQRMTI